MLLFVVPQTSLKHITLQLFYFSDFYEPALKMEERCYLIPPNMEGDFRDALKHLTHLRAPE